jgi:hypothetical protein
MHGGLLWHFPVEILSPCSPSMTPANEDRTATGEVTARSRNTPVVREHQVQEHVVECGTPALDARKDRRLPVSMDREPPASSVTAVVRR